MGRARTRKKEGKKAPVVVKDPSTGIKPASQGGVSKGPKGKWYILMAVVLVIAVGSYANSLDNGFVFDDPLVIVDNPGIRGIQNIPWLIGLTTGWAFYRPVRMVSYALDYTLNEKLWQYLGDCREPDKGLCPLGYHISNIAYHVATSFLVFLVVCRLAGNYRVAFFAAAIFALHPVHTDSVTYLSGRRDILFTLFYLAGFYFFLRYRESRQALFIIASFLAYALGMASKEMAVTLPALFLCYDLVQNFALEEKGLQRNYLQGLVASLKKSIEQSTYLYGLLFFGALAYSYYKVVVASPSFMSSYYGNSAFITFLTVGRIIVHYITLLVYPVNLNADYSFNAFPLSTSLFEPSTFLALAVLLGALYGLLRIVAKHKMLAFGGIWFFLTLLPVCHIFPHHELLAEHYLYLPSVGFCLIAAVLINSFIEKGRYGSYGMPCFMVVVLLFALRIVDRNRDWQDGLTLYEKTVKTSPECARANSNLCEAYTNQGRLDEALSACKKALAINPGHIQAANNLGTVYAKKGMVDEAIAAYREVLVSTPRYAKGHFNLGFLYFNKGDLDKAIYEYEQALAINPYYAEARNNLGIAYSAQGKVNEAVAHYKQAQAMKPYYAESYFNLGISYARRGDFDKAIEEYKRALAIKPQYADASNNLAIAYMGKGELDKAIAEFESVLAGNPDYGDVHFNLGVAYAQKGDLNKAEVEYKRAMSQESARPDLHSNLGNIYFQQGRLDEAVNEYKLALSLKDDFATAHNNLAMTYFQKREYALAIKHCDRAVELGLKVNPALLKDLLPYR